MPKFRKLPVVVEAMQFTDADKQEVIDWVQASSGGLYHPQILTLKIYTHEGVMTANLGDWIIKGVKGEFYPCKPDIFNETYEEVTE